ncbi:MAG: arylsulfatase [Deltaproteobacteria bacterium]|jgi:arylsulfatase A-like enzyme|nr:arylsulfatase [Deltaproteobacteria bacterium]MBT4640877.1 arylsulfatase [Deltaproteobacteria bacterium]MBT6503178.1 arylsulfatase [Deltaproteobacteria bacterium]MBT7155897.1 arylsulfatase [Deltaproteobacteria bacterium]MBT7711687.1 arylsulfatase [Deltaproteobacteria bacterium]
MKNRLLPLILFIVCLVCLTGIANAKSPNIVLILADDLGFSDTAPYGSEIPTPNISRLANEGLMFTNYHTAGTCAPTRGMLMTGVDSHRNGVPNMPEALPASQKEEHENYRGTLSHNVVTVATLLKGAGYHTYITGKWHLGREPDQLPSQRGFERTVTMTDTGADNWEQKTYLPLYTEPHWFADGKEIDLPEDYYSSKYFIDNMIDFIESNREDGKPFFSYIPFLAVHIPVQAPQAFIDKYMGVYDGGWHKLREKRLEMAKKLKLVPASTELADVPSTVGWDSLSAEEKRYESKKMAVYAGMVDAMDHHIGRLLTYLKKTGEYDNTVFMFTSDNGAEGGDAFDKSLSSPPELLYLRWWMKNNGYNRDYENLGTRGSYINIGPSFASAAASPLAYYKFFAHEGGMRVPLIISGPGITETDKISNALTYVTDIAPTILELAGLNPLQDSYQGRKVEPMTGKSIIPLAKGETTRIHGEEETIGYELGGNAALFQGDYKIVLDRGPVADGKWHLYNIVTDPGEKKDLREAMPERFAAMMAAYQAYVIDNNVLPVSDDYDQKKQLGINAIITQLKADYPIYVTVLLVIIALIRFLIRRWIRRRKAGKQT